MYHTYSLTLFKCRSMEWYFEVGGCMYLLHFTIRDGKVSLSSRVYWVEE